MLTRFHVFINIRMITRIPVNRNKFYPFWVQQKGSIDKIKTGGFTKKHRFNIAEPPGVLAHTLFDFSYCEYSRSWIS